MYNEKLQHTPSMPHSYSWLGLACALAGDSETGRRHAEKGLKIQSDAGYKWLGSIGWFCLGVCLAESGEFEDARLNLEKGLEISRNNNEKTTEGALLIWIGRILGQIQPPNIKNAFEYISRGIEISKGLSQRPDEAIGYLFLAELNVIRNRKDLASEFLNKAVAFFDEMEMRYWLEKSNKMQKTIGHL
jgi:tetratricopeptide (TPR) repeat protein